MEQNQNTNQQSESQETPPPELKETEDKTNQEKSITTSEVKEEIQPASQQEIQDLKPETDSMEVHKHPHHMMHKKKWNEYILEFFMIFFAVFLGFLAENTREHIIENRREKEYIKSFYEDLASDDNDFQVNINFLRGQMEEADSLQKLMPGISTSQPANRIYMYLRSITRSSAGLVYPNDRTIVQLRNAGGMRLIKNKSVSDSMVSYYRTIEIVQFLNQDGLVNKSSLREKSISLMNAFDFSKIVDSTSTVVNPGENIYLRTADSDIINSCLIEVNRIKALNSTLVKRIQALQEKAKRIRAFINREYNVENN